MITKSKSRLLSAESSLKVGDFGGSISSSYYASFQMSNAMLIVRGLSRPKHTEVRSFINKEFGRTNRFPRDLIASYNKLMDLRHDADYSEVEIITQESAERYLNVSRTFCNLMLLEINKELADLGLELEGTTDLNSFNKK
jgi:uncharacterized protein (UPF0332 family)